MRRVLAITLIYSALTIMCSTDSAIRTIKTYISQKSSAKEHLAKLFNLVSGRKDWDDCKDECSALGIKEVSLNELIALRFAVQEKLAFIENPTINNMQTAFNDETGTVISSNTSNHSPLYKYEMILKNILTQKEFDEIKLQVYYAAKGSIIASINSYKKIIKRHKNILKKIDKCLAAKILYVEENQFRAEFV